MIMDTCGPCDPRKKRSATFCRDYVIRCRAGGRLADHRRGQKVKVKPHVPDSLPLGNLQQDFNFQGYTGVPGRNSPGEDACGHMRSTIAAIYLLIVASAFYGLEVALAGSRSSADFLVRGRGHDSSIWLSSNHSEFGFVQEGKRVAVSTKPGTKADPDWVHGFSALRDVQRQEVRFFFDALRGKAEAIKRSKISFITSTADDLSEAMGVDECHLQLISDPQGMADHDDPELISASEQREFLEGWQLTCTDPGKGYNAAVFTYNGGSKYTSFSIEMIGAERVGKIAACVAPLYTARLLTRPWLFYNARLGVERFFLYRAVIADFSAGPYSLGIWPSAELSHHIPVRTFPHKGLQWLSYEAPAFRYMHGQTTALNDCLMRNRYEFEFLLVVDVDEVIRIESGPHFDLGRLLDTHFPRDASNLVVPRYTFPVKCCLKQLEESMVEDEAQSLEFFASCKEHTAKDHDFGKTIVRPDLVEGLSQHITLFHRPGAEERVVLDPQVAHLVHVKQSTGWQIPMECEIAHRGFDTGLD